MPISKIKGNAINDDAINSDRIAENIEFTGTEAVRMPQGTTAQRTSAQSGDIRFNSTLSLMEYYDGATWKAIDSPPTIVSISPASIPDTDSSFDIVITGSNFQSGATVQAIGQDSSTINATTVTVDNSSQITANFDGTSFSDAQEDYTIKVSNASGLSSELASSLAVNASPVWTTAASPTTLATVNDGDTISGSTIQVVATDDENATLTYSLDSGTLPTGLSVNSNGTITGTESGSETYSSGGTTFTPTLAVSDGSNSITRTFSIVKKWYDGSTQDQASSSAQTLYDLDSSFQSVAANGWYWIDLPTVGATKIYCDFGNASGWMLAGDISTDGSNFYYESSYWTNTTSLNDTADVSLTASLTGTTDRKYDTWGYYTTSNIGLTSNWSTSVSYSPTITSNSITSATLSSTFSGGTQAFSTNPPYLSTSSLCVSAGINRVCNSGDRAGAVTIRLGSIHIAGCYGWFGNGVSSNSQNSYRNAHHGYPLGSTPSNDGGCGSGRRWDAGNFGNIGVWVK